MNKELLEKLSAIREDLLAFKALDPDEKKLVDLAKQKVPTMRSNYRKLWPYMTAIQKSRATWLGTFEEVAFGDIQTGGNYSVVDVVTGFVPMMLADLNDIAKKLENNA